MPFTHLCKGGKQSATVAAHMATGRYGEKNKPHVSDVSNIIMHRKLQSVGSLRTIVLAWDAAR